MNKPTARPARLYVGNIPWDFTEADLRDFFSSYAVTDVKIIIDKETQRSRGFAFVELKNPNELQAAIADLDGRDMGGRIAKISVATEKPRGGGRTGGEARGDGRPRPRTPRNGQNGHARHEG
jgi:RNA recognition motif-containing protein